MVYSLFMMMILFLIAVIFTLYLHASSYIGLVVAFIMLIIFIIKMVKAEDKNITFKKNSIFLVLAIIFLYVSISSFSVLNYFKNYKGKDNTSNTNQIEERINRLYDYKYVSNNLSINIDKDSSTMIINDGNTDIILDNLNCFETSKNKYNCKGYLEDDRSLSFIFSFKNDNLVFEEYDSVLNIKSLKENTVFERVNK